MTIVELLAQQLRDAHQTLLGTLEGITDEQANFQPKGKALSVGAVWVHLAESEDMFLSTITGQPTLEASQFAGKTGFDQPQPTDNWAETYPKWAKEVNINVAQLRTFTEAIFAASESFMATLKPETLEETRDMGSMGQPTVQTIISSYLIAHCNQITGEISAIKGVQGLQGYPW